MKKENKYAKRIEKVQMSSIRIVMEKVEKLRNQGKSVVSLCAGEPDFNTPEGIKKQQLRLYMITKHIIVLIEDI